MRILVISNLYPPHYIGGYELGCQQVVEALKQQGHQVKVLTSSYGLEKPAVDGETYRWLVSDPLWLEQMPSNTPRDVIKKERVNQKAFNRLCQDFKPEAVYIWNAAHISISLAFVARQRKIPVFYYISDSWLSEWEVDSWISWCRKVPSSAVKRMAKKLTFFAFNAVGLNTMHGPLDLSRVQFTSLFMKEQTVQAGVPVVDGQVIHWGVDVDQYPCSEFAASQPTRLLFVGQTRKHKGIHTAIEAFANLKARNPALPLTLTIAGGSIVREEEILLREYIASFGIEKEVTFTGMLPRSEIIPYYQTHDVLIFPSNFDEPFSITLLEGMSSGLAVVGTTKGGSQEILQDGVNALTFPAGDASACANQLQRLLEDPELYRKIRRNGRKTVVDRFQFKMMTDKISRALLAA
jgi:glycogen(starch) synthase